MHEIPAGDAAVGDILLVRPGDRIPLDGVVTEGESRIDTSPVTGEPVPVTVRKGSRLVSGCVNEQGVLQMKVEKPLAESMVTKILDSVEKCGCQQAETGPLYHKICQGLHAHRSAGGSGHGDHTVSHNRELERVDLHGDHFPCHQLPLRSCPERPPCLFLRYWGRVEKGYPL